MSIPFCKKIVVRMKYGRLIGEFFIELCLPSSNFKLLLAAFLLAERFLERNWSIIDKKSKPVSTSDLKTKLENN